MSDEQARRAASLPARAYRCVLGAGLLLVLAANLPGQLSYDSVVQLYEGRTGERITWAPGIMTWLLGAFDRLIPGTSLYVTLSCLVLFAALWSLAGLRPRMSWLGPLVALGFVLSPMVLIYQGIVWKDVLFANMAIAGLVALAWAAHRWPNRRARLAALGLAAVCLATAALARQNGAVAILLGAVALAWIAWGEGWKQALAWGVGGLAATLLLSQAIGLAVQPPGSRAAEDADKGMRILRHYDIVGAAAYDPSVKLDILAKASPEAERLVRSEGVKVYSPERVDTFAKAPRLGDALWQIPKEAVAAQWRALIVEQPGAYLGERAEVFRWVLTTPTLNRCLPLHVGVDGSPAFMAALRLSPGTDPQDEALARYGMRFAATPVFSHLTYLAIAVAVAGVLLLRRDPADIAVIALMASAVAFAASFFVISLACDYRYLYFLDLAAMTGLLYLAIDPPRLRRPA